MREVIDDACRVVWDGEKAIDTRSGRVVDPETGEVSSKEKPARGDLKYNTGVTTFSSGIWSPVPYEGLGFLGSYSVSGYLNIARNSQGSYSATVTALARSPVLQNAGSVEFFGKLVISMDGTPVYNSPLTPPSEPYVISQDSTMIGTADFLLPPENLNISFDVEIEVGFRLTVPEGQYWSPISRISLPIF